MKPSANSRQLDAEQAKIVELRYFAGMSVEEAAEVMGISPATLEAAMDACAGMAVPGVDRSEPADATPMNPEQRRRARDLFEAALEHDPADIAEMARISGGR